ncbi:LysE family translocator [Pelagicoccus sp. NFK12]|uniref:LysE family translocator n=1 Tax=Pelagicoccus enzymogenes TaxID=2773457 RepID=A0A927IDJ3_9BACT|nr:LysE family translocator [Pelagicoccus enzymogenes]MBD5778047.1 LysE family translocator [Pelagicoccus enzymogenes]
MLSTELILTFLATSALLAITPGPDNLFVMTQAALHGRKSGFVVTLGLCTGLIVHSVAVALGVSAIFQSSVAAFNLLKYLGVAYLVYLAWKAFRASSDAVGEEQKVQASYANLYRRGIIMNVTNPKVSIFFLAFLPQFTDPSAGNVTSQILALGGLFIVATLVIFGSIATLSGLLNDLFKKSSRAQTIMNKIAGLVFLGIAAKLMAAKQ